MLVVLAIIGLVTAMSFPLLAQFTRGRKVEQAAETVKSSCLTARSKAIKQRRRFSVTLLERERKVIVSDYDMLRYMLPLRETGSASDGSSVTTLDRPPSSTTDWEGYYITMVSGQGAGQHRLITGASGTTLAVEEAWSAIPPPPASANWAFPAEGDGYAIGGKGSNDLADYVSPHYIGNYGDADERDSVLTQMAVSRPKTLPEGCRFDLDADRSDPTSPEAHGWTYVFLPTGGAWTLNTDAVNAKDSNWFQTTYQNSAGEFAGPLVFGPGDETLETIIVYAMTGKAVDEP